jgi:hypothetical protein
MFFFIHVLIHVNEQEKDERNDEYKWNVYPGMVLRMMFWADAARGGKADKFREEMCPAGHDIIKAFTLLELELTCKVCIL